MITGAGAIDFLQKITPSLWGKLAQGRAKYSVLTNEQGGIIDDLIITRIGEDRFFAVINAGCKDKDIQWMKDHLPDNVQMDVLDDRALIALQGADSEMVMRDVFGLDLTDMPYMWLQEARIADDVNALISRLGYTGEDGFEISVPAAHAVMVWERLAAHESVKPIGLAARDSLRLEMGYCLYGHDIDDKTTPVEAGLGWVIGKGHDGFIGAQKVLAHKKDGALKKRVGVRLSGKGVAREGAPILCAKTEKEIGMLTSGGFSPSLKQAIGQGYVESAFAADDTPVFVQVRGRNIEAKIDKMPFVEAKTKSPQVKEIKRKEA